MLVLPVLEAGRIRTLPLFLVLSRYANLCVAVFMAPEQAGRQSAVTSIIGGCRLLAIAAAALLPSVLTSQALVGLARGRLGGRRALSRHDRPGARRPAAA